MTTYELAMLAPMVGLLLWAAATDFRARRIPNWLTFSLLIAGLGGSFIFSPAVTPLQSLFGLLTGFGLTVVPFALGALGGGDVKLMAGIGAWLGPWPTLQIFAAAAIFGLFIVLIQCARQGRLRVLLRNTAILLFNLAHIQQFGVDHVAETAQSNPTIAKPLPYAVPVLCGAVLVLLNGWMGK